MKTIALTQGQVALVDDEDFEFLSSRKWCAAWYSSTGTFYAMATIGRKKIPLSMARVILAAPKGIQVDHKNRDTLDNRRENLRLATVQQNQANRKSWSRSGYRGVSQIPSMRFCAQITVNKKSIYLGSFPTIEGAARAYDTAAITHFGEFASLNFPV